MSTEKQILDKSKQVIKDIENLNKATTPKQVDKIMDKTHTSIQKIIKLIDKLEKEESNN